MMNHQRVKMLLNNCKLRLHGQIHSNLLYCTRFTRRCLTSFPNIKPEECLKLENAPKDFNIDDVVIIPGFVKDDEVDQVFKVGLRKVKRICGKHYQAGHFDHVIKDYRECTVASWGHGLGGYLSGKLKGNLESLRHGQTVLPEDDLDEMVKRVFQRAYALFPEDTRFLPLHLLELAKKTGEILGHVDNVRESGSFVAGICLGSDAVVRFAATNGSGHVDVLLPEGCFYMQRGKLRYRYTHAIPLDPEIRRWNGKEVEARQRLTILFRDELDRNDLPMDYEEVDAQGRSMSSQRALRSSL